MVERYQAHPTPEAFANTTIDRVALASAFCERMSADDYPWAFEHCISYAAGALAQSRVDGNPDRVRDGARSDHERAQILAEAVTDSDDAARDMLREARREAETIIEDDWARIVEVAQALYSRGRLDEEEVRRAMFGDGYRSPERTPPTPKRVADSGPRGSNRRERPYVDRGPEALGLAASHVAAGYERAGSPHSEHLFRLRARFLDARGY